MSYQVFARKYRPRTFADLLGQDHVVRTLRNAIAQNRLAHAYLFVGPRGTGKTSTARIFAKALNCSQGPRADFDPDEDVCVEIAEGRSLDVIEIDGASNNGVENVRELRESVRFAPVRGQFKIYYIDEVHMLSTGAFNALLKTLEEPPPHVKFIFATTEVNKILPTILSRCQRFDLRPIPTGVIADHLREIAGREGVELEEAAAWAIARGADGGMRDAQSMLDQLVAFCGERICEEQVLDVFGFTSREKVAALAGAVLGKETPAALTMVLQEAGSGRDLSQLLGELIGALRALLVAKLDPSADGEGIPEEAWTRLMETARAIPTERILAVIDVFADTEARMKWASNKRLHFELGIIKAVQALNEARISDVIRALSAAADAVPSATFAATRESAPPAVSPPPAPRRSTAGPATRPGGSASLDSLIESAPEASEPDPQEAKKQPAPPAATEAPTREAADVPPVEEDPLIRAALEKFRGRIVSG